jgi:outer membrane receptor protein involved in Fe transport
VNVDESIATGLELEGVWNPLNNFEVRANFSLIYSETNLVVTDSLAGRVRSETREMFGQAPWIVNLMATYNWEKIGLIASASYNVQGPKLAATNLPEIAAPLVYEMPRHLIDLKVAKRIGEHFTVDFRIRNLLNSPIRRSYNFDAGFDLVDFDRYAWGTNYILGVAYNL